MEEELWQIIFLVKHLPNVRNNPKMTLTNCYMKKIETSILNFIHNLLLNFDQFNISYHFKKFYFYLFPLESVAISFCKHGLILICIE